MEDQNDVHARRLADADYATIERRILERCKIRFEGDVIKQLAAFDNNVSYDDVTQEQRNEAAHKHRHWLFGFHYGGGWRKGR